MSDLEQFQSDFALLVEAGFVAVSRLMEGPATKLFHAAQVLNEEHTLPQIGLASIALHKLDTKNSNKILEQVMEKEPDNHRAGALLGISWILSQKDMEGGEKLLQRAMKEADDEATRRLGALWLEVLDKGVRKSDSPVQPQKPKETQKK